ncbi:hypothetical protein IFM46972_03432 [Aspergillus udagawae]|uniref:Uncharacterized protein n=1 Tax=Aspergillus udagawae TaxID=91492 RepID=A0A8H3NHY9_9EURO|nr:hypothetical protein IFM46972_03432 [Aspergillus udagawae]
MTLLKLALVCTCVAPLILAQQQVLRQSRRFTLDDVVPSTDPISRQVKCCPEGTQFDGKTCSLGIPTCADPSTYYSDGLCVSTTPPRCDKGTFNGKTCVSTTPPECPAPYRRKGATCISDQAPDCGADFYLDEGLCKSTTQPRCDEGSLKGNVCVKPPRCPDPSATLSNGVCIQAGAPDCGSTARFDPASGHCVAHLDPQCPSGLVRQGDLCISQDGPQCPSGLTYQESTQSCVGSKPPQCPKGVPRQGDWCVQVSTPDCPLDTVLSTDRASNTARCCPVSMAWDGERCVTKPDSHGQCPSDTYLDNGLCKKPGNAQGDCAVGTLNPSGTQCVLSVPAQCPKGLVADGDTCRSTKGPQCPPKMTKKGNDCISDEGPTCTGSNTRLENGQCVTTTTPSCRPNYQWDGQNCVSEDHPGCEFPGTWDGQACVLPGSPTCSGTNTVPVPVNGSCIAQFRPRCQPPTVESNGVCLVDQKVKCKEGVFNGQDCVLSDKPRCPPRTTPSGDKCVATSTPNCQTGYKWVGGQCVSIDADPCGDGFREENGQCVSDTKPECTGTSYLDGDHCVGGKPSCADGVFDNGDCVSDELPQCTPPKIFKNGQCVEIHAPACYPPFVFDPVKNTCVDVQGPRCPQGQVYHGGKCVLVPDQDCLEYEWCPALPVIAQSLKFLMHGLNLLRVVAYLMSATCVMRNQFSDPNFVMGLSLLAAYETSKILDMVGSESG